MDCDRLIPCGGPDESMESVRCTLAGRATSGFEWLDAKVSALHYLPSPESNFGYCAEGGKLMTLQFDSRMRSHGPPF